MRRGCREVATRREFAHIGYTFIRQTSAPAWGYHQRVIHAAEILAILAAKRPVFHSEADFQHAFAWETQRQHPNASIRLEYRPALLPTRTYVDVWVMDGDRTLAIELKYKTALLSVQVDGEQFDLLSQSAQDLGRYDFVRDLWRLEQVATCYPNARTLAILLTNESKYWRPATRSTFDASFQVHEGHHIEGLLKWALGTGAGTMKNREESLSLARTYACAWKVVFTDRVAQERRVQILGVGVRPTSPLRNRLN
jgi:hypothetical protein